MRQLCTLLLVFGLSTPFFAQNNFWAPIKISAISLSESATPKAQPKQFQAFSLNYAQMFAALSQAPMEFTAAARQQAVVLRIPFADGSFHTFRVWESPVMAPELMAKFPTIKTYAGVDAEGMGLTLRMGVGDQGFHAYVFEANGHFQAIRPYADGNTEYYVSYRQEDMPALADDLSHKAQCGVDEHQPHLMPSTNDLPPASVNRGSADPISLRKYRLAVSTQGEYSQHFGGTKPMILSAVVEAVNFIVAITERDWGLRLELIPNNDTLFYLNPATDPFTGPLIPNWIGDNPAAINTLINVNTYDIGHLFAKVQNPGGIYVAGQAALSGVCTQILKAVAGSSLPIPDGPGYYLIIAHEIGHQFSATHTFNRCVPSQDALTASTAYEPGGGTTIMSYSTTCFPDIVGDTEAYFHVANLEQVANFITLEVGSTCPVLVPTSNRAPVVNIPLPDNFFIPISTPFELTGVATDEDGDVMTYCWEQFNLGPSSPLGQPAFDAPTFRSFFPTNTPTRTFPLLANIINNTNTNLEVLPTYSRELKFKFTVRDNNSEVGGVAIDEVRFRSAASAGPFRVSYPTNTSAVWNVGEYQTVTWDVANTNAAPVNCQRVNIRLSLDGGLTYPVTLAAGQPNIGRACIQVPSNLTNMARVRIDAADNIFFDISNANFAIRNAPTPGVSLCADKLVDFVCLPESYNIDINTAAVASFADPVTLDVAGLPSGAVGVFSPNPVVPGQNSTLSITFPMGLPEQTFDAVITGTVGAFSTSTTVTLTTVNNDFTTFSPTAPAHGATGVNPNPLLTWSTSLDANFYDVEVATNPSFAPNTLVATQFNIVIGSYQVTTILDEGAVYYWRIRAKNDCGGAVWSPTRAFVVTVQSCINLSANDVPQNITPNGTPTIESKITLLSGGTISDVNITKVQGFHTYFRDLEARLISPAGTDILLWKDRCGSYNGPFDISFDDGAGAVFSCPPPTSNGEAKPSGSLSSLIGQDATGVWTLRVKDNTVSSGGTLSAFSLQICSDEATSPPFVTVNNVLQPVSGNNAAIDINFLKAEDANNTANQIIFTLVDIPEKGLLLLYGNPMGIGEQFSQADIDNGGLRYGDYGWNAGGDSFRFVVSDNEGGLETGVFQISALVSTKDIPSGLAFGLAPNPASDFIRLSLGTPLNSDARVVMYNAAGQQVHTWILGAGTMFMSLQVSDLPEGVYAIAVENEAIRGVRKVVVR